MSENTEKYRVQKVTLNGKVSYYPQERSTLYNTWFFIRKPLLFGDYYLSDTRGWWSGYKTKKEAFEVCKLRGEKAKNPNSIEYIYTEEESDEEV
jgi:hypothetical protein